MVYTLLFFPSKCSLFHNSNVFGSCIIHISYTECAKKNNSGAKRLKVKSGKISWLKEILHVDLEETREFLDILSPYSRTLIVTSKHASIFSLICIPCHYQQISYHSCELRFQLPYFSWSFVHFKYKIVTSVQNGDILQQVVENIPLCITYHPPLSVQIPTNCWMLRVADWSPKVLVRSNCGSSCWNCSAIRRMPVASLGKEPMENLNWQILMRWRGDGGSESQSLIWITTSSAERSGKKI